MNEQDVVSFFTGKGYEPHQAAGIAGNLMQESTLNPTAKNPTSGAYGLPQWLGSRKKAFFDYTVKNKKDAADPLTQLEFMDLELNTTEKKAKDKLLATTTATDAAHTFSNAYERAGANEKKNAKRASYAEKIFSAIVPSAQAGEITPKEMTIEEWVAAGEPDSLTPTTATKKPPVAKEMTIEEWVAAGEPDTLDPKAISWGKTGEKFAKNVIPDTFAQAWEGIKAIPDVIAHPLNTMAGIRHLATGSVTSLLPKAAQTGLDKANVAMWNVMPKDVQDTLTYLGFNPLGSEQDRKMAREFFKPYSSVDDFKQTLANNPGRITMDLSTLASGGASLAGKAGLTRTATALGNVGTYTNPLTPVAAVASKVAPVVGKLATAPVNYLRDVISPKNALLVEAAEGRGPAIVNALRAQNEIVPGSIPTAGQAAVPAGATRYAALQTEVAEKAPTAYLERAAEQNKARLALIQNLAKTEADMLAADQLRSGTTTPIYTSARAGGDIVDVSNVVAKIDDLIAKNPGDKPLLTQLNSIKSGLIDDAGNIRVNAQEISSSLGGIKAALKNPENTYIKKELTGIKQDIIDAIPNYATADKTYATLSEPINKMKVGQFLKDKLKSTLSEDVLRPGVFVKAVEEAPTTLKRATGESRFKKLTEIYSPDEINSINSVVKDMKRQYKFELQAKAGARAGKFLPAAEIGTLPGLISVVVTTANAIIRRLQGKISEKVALELAYEGLDLPKAAASLEKAIKSQQRLENIGKAIATKGNQAKAITRAPQTQAVVNALATTQNQNALANQ